MKLEHRKKIGYGRCETPANTIARLKGILDSLYDYRLIEQKVAEHLHWTALEIDELGFRSMGKGITAEFSLAGAFAECAEWIAALEIDKLPGLTTAHQVDLAHPLRMEDLLCHVVE